MKTTLRTLRFVVLALFLCSASFGAQGDMKIPQVVSTTPTLAWKDRIFPTYSGGLFVTGADGIPYVLAPGTNGYQLTMQSGLPTWTSGGTPGSGTVTSVGLSLPNIFTVTNSPVTSSGTLTGTFASQAKNMFLAGPVSGSNAAPTMRLLSTQDIPVAVYPGNYTNTWNAFGDSITVGTGASDTAHSYVGLLGTATGWTVTNYGDSGREIQDFVATDIYPVTITTSSVSSTLFGYNNMRHTGANPDALYTYERCLNAAMAWLTNIPAGRKYAQNGSVAVTGSWSNVSLYSGAVAGKQSSTSAATLTAEVYGSTVYLGYTCRAGLGDGGSFIISVDGTVIATVNTNRGVLPYSGILFWPEVYVVRGLVNAPHTVIVTTTSTSPVNIDYFAGNYGADSSAQARVYAGNTLRMTSTGYALAAPFNNGSDAAVNSFNLINSSVSQNFLSDGFGITFVDASTTYNPNAGELNADNIHPNDTGHQLIAYAFQARMNALSPLGTPGSVIGPQSSTDTAIAVYDGTSGNRIKNSAAKVTDSSVQVQYAASDTIGSGSNFAAFNSGGDAGYALQLNASAGMDIWMRASSSWTKRSTFTSGGILQQTNAIQQAYAASNTIGSGSYYTLQDAAASNGYALQLNASYGLDFWNQASGSWTKRATLSSAGAFAPASVAATGTVTGSNLSGTNTGDQNLFGSVVVSGQTAVTASANPTTLTLVAGTNVTITTDNTAKSVTINSTGAGTGTVTVVGAGSLTSTALVTGGGTQTLQTPSATSTLDSSGNLSVAGNTAVGGNLNVTGSTTVASISTGAVTGTSLTISGGTLTLGTTTSTITGAAGNMTITAGTGNSRTLSLQSTTSGGTATTFLTGNADQSVTFAAGFTASGAASIGTSNAFTAGTIELGAASDTTLSRSSAGVLAVEGVVVPTVSSTSTLTNKTLTSPVVTLAASALADDTYTGTVVTSYNAGATLTQWDLVYLDSSSTWQKADADTISTADGVVVAGTSSGNPAIVLVRGAFRDDGGTAYTPGVVLYMSQTAGAITATAPSAASTYVNTVGKALSAHVVLVNASQTFFQN